MMSRVKLRKKKSSSHILYLIHKHSRIFQLQSDSVLIEGILVSSLESSFPLHISYFIAIFSLKNKYVVVILLDAFNDKVLVLN